MHPGIFPSVAIACLALAAGDATAVALNPRGVGEVLIYPYYTVNGGQDTLLTLDNVSDIGKAARVFIREGANGREVMGFFVFLAPHDSWSGAISSSGEGALARIGSSDRSCVDYWSSNPQPFSTSEFNPTYPGGIPSGWKTPDRTREGMIEVINAGDIVPGSALDLATKPGQDGSAPSCSGARADVHLIAYLQAPTEGLTGTAAIANVAQGTFYPYDAVALSGFSDAVLINPTAALWSGLDRAYNSDATNGRARAKLVTGGGEPLALDYARGIDAVSAVFMADHLYNEYLDNADIGAATDWVVTFPTRQFYVDKQRYPGDTTAPFEGAADDYVSPVTIEFDSYDREGLTATARCPPLLEGCFTRLPFQVNVVPIGGMYAPSLLGSRLNGEATLPPMGASGHIELSLGTFPNTEVHVLSGGKAEDGTAVALHGLPVTGFMVYNIVNAHAQPGRLANYGGLFPHRTTLNCTTAGSDSIALCP